MNKKHHSSKTSAKGFHSNVQFKWVVAALLVYFGLRLLFFALTISPNVPPDEVTHFGLCQIYSRVLSLPHNSSETYEYGLVTNTPYLYYWIMGRILAINYSGIPDLLFLRLLNIPFAFATVFFVWRILRLLTSENLPQFLLIVAMTNTLMFTFLSATISYDNLINILAAMAIYYLLAFFRYRSGDLLALSLLCQLAGCLTKVSFLPLVLAMNGVLIVCEFKNLRHLPLAFRTYLQFLNGRRILIALGIVIVFVLNVQLYGGNFYRYRKLSPSMSDVVSMDKAMQHRVTARNTIFRLFKEGKITKNQAMMMALEIKHPGDRTGALYLIENYDALKRSNLKLMNPPKYAWFWLRQMGAGIFGIMGHLGMFNFGPFLRLFGALGVLALLAFLLRWRGHDTERLSLIMIVIALFYGIFIMYEVNYGSYLFTGSPVLAVQGRYIFPVIGPIYVLASCYLPQLFKKRYAQLILVTAASVLFLSSDLPYFLFHVTPDWYAPLLR